MQSRRSQRGFTLIELVVVLVILGILAAFAIPRFININRDAREAALKGLSGSVRSAVALVHGMALARGQTGATGTVQLEGQDIDLVFGYPIAGDTGIKRAINNIEGFTEIPPAGSPPMIGWRPANQPADVTLCRVMYQQAQSAIAPAAVTMPATLDCS